MFSVFMFLFLLGKVYPSKFSSYRLDHSRFLLLLVIIDLYFKLIDVAGNIMGTKVKKSLGIAGDRKPVLFFSFLFF